MEKRWLQSYQQGVAHDLIPTPYTTLVELLAQSCERYKEKIAYNNMGSTLSYQQLDELSAQLAAYLQSQVSEPGARVAVMLPNILQYPVSIFAILRAGFMVVNVNPLYTASELIHQLKDSGASAIICLANMAKVVETALPLTNVKTIIVTEIGDLFPVVKGFIVNSVVKYIKRMVPAWHIPQAVKFKQALQQGAKQTLRQVTIQGQDIALLQYTGGTTGVAKGAMLSHQNILANVAQMQAWLQPCLTTCPLDIVVTPLPLYHIFSLTVNCITFLSLGACNILITNPRDIGGLVAELRGIKFAVITGVNTLFKAIIDHPKFANLNFSKLCLSFGGGMPVQEAVAEKWQKITHCPLLEGYGLTEASPVVAANPLHQTIYNGSIGLPMPGTDIRICDEEGNELPVGKAGQLWVKGPQVMQGYWQQPEETAQVLKPSGWLLTGDLMKMDNEGYLYYVDRIKDMINVSGLKVYPCEVEEVLAHHPGVQEVAVIGENDPHSGEIVKACIVKKDPHIQEVDIINYCYKHLARYKVPKRVEFCATLPKSHIGKVLKKALKM